MAPLRGPANFGGKMAIEPANIRPFRTPEVCGGEHNFYVAEVIGVETEGSVFVLALCRHCDKFAVHEVKVSSPGAPIRLLREESQNKER
jgi:hypothetical protein